MFPSRLQGITRLHFFLQLVGVVALVWIVFPLVNWLRFAGGLTSVHYFEATVVLVCASILELLTRPPETRHLSGLSKHQLSGVTHRQMLFALVSIFGTMVMLKDDSLSRVFLSVFFLLYFFWIAWTNRFGYRMLHRFLYRNESKGLSRALLVGSRSAVSRFHASPASLKPPGTDILGFVAVEPDGGGAGAMTLQLSLPQVGVIENLHSICEETKARALLLLGMTDRRDLIKPLADISSELGLRTMWLDDVNSHFGARSQAFHAENYSVVTQLREPLEDPVNRALKRMLDLAGALFGVVVILPPMMCFVHLLQRYQSPGPLFYRQERSGRNGETFKMFKFRSMVIAKEGEEFKQATEHDPRIFKGGSLIRKLSIDELPQLINVLRGEMSLVGPRPHPLPLDSRLVTESRVYRLRHLAKPGITGLAQSRGWRGETRQADQVRNRIRLDLFYIQNWSIGFDLRIMFETVWQVIRPPKSAR
ncbi:MAG: exopolysaccharide biosynthesis polyprenyl glycosylphosphotransferase [Verrucomicrobiales bacterium]|nr:exopolysaccharide biosynthesis polyprenyl glycosylphosphotransferase [Verrucomicrobiales bacterium]